MRSGPRHRPSGPCPGLETLRAALLGLVATAAALVPAGAEPPAGEPAPPPPRPAGLLDDRWDVITIQGQRVGFSHTRRIAIQQAGRRLEQTEMMVSIKMKRLGQPVAMKTEIQSVETPEGELLRTRSRLVLGPVPVEAVGHVAADQLQLQIRSLGKTTTTTLAWSPEYRGFFGMEQSLRADPLQPGQRRQLKALVPLFHQLADVELVAEDFEETEMLNGRPQRLLKIGAVTKLGLVDLRSTVWTDPQGEVLKMLEPSLQQVTFRATRQVALENTEAMELDLVADTLIPVAGLEDVQRATAVRYRVSLGQPRAGDDLRQIFPPSAAQSTAVGEDGQAVVTVRRLRVGGENDHQGPAGDRPTARDREANTWIQSDDPLVVRLAGEVLPHEQNRGLLAVALERRVGELITEKDFTTALATAAEVARSRQGDCSEHAVLLAALLRARQIPARVVVGLVYVPPLAAFGYHMWNEAWIDGGWLPLDATQGQGGTGVGHIKLADDDLGAANAATSFLPVVQVMGRLEIAVERVER